MLATGARHLGLPEYVDPARQIHYFRHKANLVLIVKKMLRKGSQSFSLLRRKSLHADTEVGNVATQGRDTCAYLAMPFGGIFFSSA